MYQGGVREPQRGAAFPQSPPQAPCVVATCGQQEKGEELTNQMQKFKGMSKHQHGQLHVPLHVAHLYDNNSGSLNVNTRFSLF